MACQQKGRQEGNSENDIDAARNFIRAALDGKFEDARNYLLTDSLNTNYLDLAERRYQRIDAETKRGYRASSIHVHKVTHPVKDSVTVIIYSNSFKNDHDTLKLLRQQGKWFVDLKYLYGHDADNLPSDKMINDSLR